LNLSLSLGANPKKIQSIQAKMPSTGDKITYAWAAEKKGTTFVAVSELLADDGKYKPVKHTLCDGTEIIQRISAGDFQKSDGGWWGFFKNKRDNKVPFVPKGAAAAAEKPAKAKAAKPSNDIIEPAKRFLGTKGKVPENVWIPKVRYDELLRAEAEHKAALVRTLEIHDKQEEMGNIICGVCQTYHPEEQIWGCSEDCGTNCCNVCLEDQGRCPACVPKVPVMEEQLDDEEEESDDEEEAEEKEEADDEEEEADDEEEEAEEKEDDEEEAEEKTPSDITNRWSIKITKNMVGSRAQWAWAVIDSATVGNKVDGSSTDWTKKKAEERSKAMLESFVAAEKKKQSVY